MQNKDVLDKSIHFLYLMNMLSTSYVPGIGATQSLKQILSLDGMSILREIRFSIIKTNM